MNVPDMAEALAAVQAMAREVMACKTNEEAGARRAKALRARMLAVMQAMGSSRFDVTDPEDGADLGTVVLTAGGTTVVVSDEDKLMGWVEDNRPDELIPVRIIRTSYLKALLEAVKTRGEPVDADGTPIPGLSVVAKEPHITTTPNHVAYARARERAGD